MLDKNILDLQMRMTLIDYLQSEVERFSHMLGTLDYMNWNWRNHPSAWHGQYTGHVHEPKIIIEAVVA